MSAQISPQEEPQAAASFTGWKRKLVVILVILGIVIITMLLIGLMSATEQKPEVKRRGNPSLAVMATQAYSDTVVLDVVLQGQSRPRTEVDVTPQVGGKVIYVSPRFVAGGQFRKGDTLLKLEEADFQVNVLRAQAAVARAEQLVIREKAEGAIARADWADLGRGGEPSPLTIRLPQLAEAEAGLLSAQADLDNAKLQLSRTVIKAPFNGRIRERFADIGQFVGPGTRLARVFSTEAIEVPLSLNDADLTRVNVPLDMSMTKRADAPDVVLSTIIAGKRQEWKGKIVRTAGTFDPQTRTLSAIAEVLDPFGKGVSDGGMPLPPGLFVDAEIVGKTLEAAIVIPRDALRPEDKVYVVNDKGKALSRDAIVLDTNAQRAVLGGGVESGELVIVSPLEKSQLSLDFKVLDFNDPKTVLIEPPKPDWSKMTEKKPEEKKKGWFGRKKKDDDKTSKSDDADKKNDANKNAKSSGEGQSKGTP